jgi:copper(I)-binding protein
VVVTDVLLGGGSQDTADVRATIVNEGDAPDRLLTIASPVAAGGQIAGDSALAARQALTTGYPPDPPPSGTARVTLRLTGLSSTVRPGLTYPVDLTFARAGTLRLNVPVARPVDG